MCCLSGSWRLALWRAGQGGWLQGWCRSLLNGSPCEQPGRVKGGQGANLIVENQREFSAPQNNGIALVLYLHSFNDGEKLEEVFFRSSVKNQTVKNYRIDTIPLLNLWHNGLQSDR